MDTIFVPTSGELTRDAVEAAAREYERRRELGGGDMGSLLIASDVPLSTWLAGTLNGHCCGVVLAATYKGDPKDANTLASVYIVRATGDAHQDAVGSLHAQLRILCAPWRNIIRPSPGSLLTQNGLSREPDVVVRPRRNGDAADKGPRMVVEFDHKGLSFPEAKDWIKGYFTMLPSLRTAIAFKIFGPLGGNRYSFGAVVLVYRREPDDPVRNVPGPPVLVYGASIGTAPLSSQSQRDMTPEDLAFFEANAFHDGIAAEIALGHFEWAAATPRPVIPLLVEDLFYADPHNLLAGAPPHAQNLQIDIYDVIYSAWCNM
ncbi:hypothetical protein ACHHYP_14850 [Achlya hypogyna]|uniref:Uncharacterized protein n=1 Tax=Achlya hypogyna TaxID=1202772 RepID=A0A1V9YC71_ACHHY|nr:hypothetical protein ACHHYP_14850 [Achlya hypogyna]